MDEDILERTTAGEFQTLEHHPADPEGQNIITRYQGVVREVAFEVS